MKCLKCVWLKKKSTVRIDRSMIGCLVLHHHDDYYDEDGKHHFHENVCNYSPDTAHCSNGHNWQIINVASCWCGWGDKEDPVKWIPDDEPLGEGNDDVVRVEVSGVYSDATLSIEDIDVGMDRSFKQP